MSTSRPQRPSDSIPYQVGDVVVGRHHFRLEKLLGSGAFAKVYEVGCLEANEGSTESMPFKAALKVLTKDLDPTQFDLLRREISTLLALDDARVPRILEWGEFEGHPFVAMELFPAGSLQDHVELTERPLTEQAAWRLMEDLLRAVSSAHAAGILHLDIKPANVLLDGRGGFVLTDFGCSESLLLHRQGKTSFVMGTPAFCAPEQARLRPEDYDARTDLYSIGATVWACLVGSTPMKAARERGQLKPFPIPPLKEYRPDVGPDMLTMIRFLTQEDRHLRPGSAADALARVLDMRRGGPSTTAVPGRFLTDEQLEKLPTLILDPLWLDIVERKLDTLFCVTFGDGDVLIQEGDLGGHAFVLLYGQVGVERNGKLLAIEGRQGTLLGEAAALTGAVRSASVRARGMVICAVFKAADLEEFLADNPAIAMRVVKTLSLRLSRESRR